MPTASHTLVIGGGIGGLATALCLRHFGVECEVFEQAATLGEVGAGIQMTPNAVKVLRALGLESSLHEISSRPSSIIARDLSNGRRLFEVPLGSVAETQFGAPYCLVHRADLIALLSGPLAGGPVTLRARCQSLEQTSHSVRARFEDGRSVDGKILVGCDGIHSVVRETLYGKEPADFTGNMCWRATIAASEAIRGAALEHATLWMGPSSHVVTYPIRKGAMINIVAVHETPVWAKQSWSLEGDSAELRDVFADAHEELGALLHSVNRCFKWGLFDREPLARWSQGRATILGDAAHPMLPFLAQGAAMAIEDAFVLAREIARSRDDSVAALERYEAERRHRTALVQMAARAQGRTNHLRNPIRRFLRDMGYQVRRSWQRRTNALRTNWIYEYDATRSDSSRPVTH
jgi:salicylate hydroxylase